MKKILIFFIIIFVSSCSYNLSTKANFLLTSDLPAGEYVKESGKKLINQPYGFTQIIGDSAKIDDTLIIAVHGYESRGYEWVTSITSLADKHNNTYFYRYDWNICPEITARSLADSIKELFDTIQHINKIIIFGHSYGGLVVTYLASNLDLNIPIEINTIAAPLAGYPRIMDKCNLDYDENDKLLYPLWEDYISLTQWKTQKHQDGAFRDLDYDPQDINFDNGKIILLPETMNGQRLGHNWSITWVINNYLKD